MAVLHNGRSLLIPKALPILPFNRRHPHLPASVVQTRYLHANAKLKCSSSDFQIKSFDIEKSEVIADYIYRDPAVTNGLEKITAGDNSPFLSKLGIFLAIGAAITLISAGVKPPEQGTSFGIQYILDGSSSSTSAVTSGAINFQAFGYRVVLPEYAPGWTYFCLLMAAGCGLFISEEALNIWVGSTLARLLSLDGTWHSFIDSFSRNAPYIISTCMWVYWGVTISDMIPFYFGKLFKQSGAPDNIFSKLGVGKDKAAEIIRSVKKYGDLIGFVERFSIGARNATAFLAGAMDISPECFFAGVCCGGLITLPLQFAVGFLLRESPLVAFATVATILGIWTAFPYAMATLTAIFMYLRRRYSS